MLFFYLGQRANRDDAVPFDGDRSTRNHAPVGVLGPNQPSLDEYVCHRIFS
jgi:hypothetical protein